MNKKRKVAKRIAAWLMCLAMVLTTVNLPAFTTIVKADTLKTIKIVEAVSDSNEYSGRGEAGGETIYFEPVEGASSYTGRLLECVDSTDYQLVNLNNITLDSVSGNYKMYCPESYLKQHGKGVDNPIFVFEVKAFDSHDDEIAAGSIAKVRFYHTIVDPVVELRQNGKAYVTCGGYTDNVHIAVYEKRKSSSGYRLVTEKKVINTTGKVTCDFTEEMDTEYTYHVTVWTSSNNPYVRDSAIVTSADVMRKDQNAEGWDIDDNGCLYLFGNIHNPAKWMDSSTKVPWNEYKTKITSVIAEPGASIDNCECLFYNCENLKEADLSNLNTSGVTSMGFMFASCKLLTSVDISGFDTSSVTDMTGMFLLCKKLHKLDLQEFAVTDTLTVDAMLAGYDELNELKLNKRILNKVADQLFTTVDARWDNMEDGTVYTSEEELKAVAGEVSLRRIAKHGTGWYLTGDRELHLIGAISNPTTSSENHVPWGSYIRDIEKVIAEPGAYIDNGKCLFLNCSYVTEMDLKNLDTSAVSDMEMMFYECSSLKTLDLGNFDTSSVTNMHSMFAQCTNLTTLDLSNFNTQNVGDISFMFYQCTNLAKLNISSFQVSDTTNGGDLIGGCKSLIEIGINHDVLNMKYGNAITRLRNVYPLWDNKADGTMYEKESDLAEIEGTVTLLKHIHIYDRYYSHKDGTHTQICKCWAANPECSNVDCSGGTATCQEKAKCKYCGEEYGEMESHDFSKYVSNGNDTHKVVCADCGAVQEGHDKDACSGGTATCTSKAKCSKCKAEYGSLKAHTNTTTTTKATLTANGKKVTKCSVCGNVSSTSTIYYPKTFTLSKASCEYTGSQIKPVLTVKDSKGNTIAATNYTLTYGTNKAVGKGTVKVTFKSTSNYSESKELSFKIVPKKTTIGTPVIASDGITVKWTKNTTGAGYYIYRSVNGASYTKVKTITSNATISWKDTTAKTNGNKYQYKIVAYKTVSGTTFTSASSAIKTTYFLTRPTVTLANQASAIKVSWGKNTKATGYYVYKSTDGGKTYKNIKTISSNTTVSYTDTAAKTNGTKYMYKVVAYKTVSGTTYKSVASAVKTYYFVSKPAISSATNSAAGKMTVKWGKNSKATGYQIQYSLKSDFSSGNKSVTVTSASTVSKVITGLTKGKTYYVRIRTYKTVGSTKYYSAWSAKKSVKITR